MIATVIYLTYFASSVVVPFAAIQIPRHLNALLPLRGARHLELNLTASVFLGLLLAKLNLVISHFLRFMLIPDHLLNS